MARRLLGAGHRLTVYDVRKEAIRPLVEAGAGEASGVPQLAAASRFIFTSLPLPDDVEAVYLGQAGIASSMAPGTTCVDVSTIDPFTARRVADGVAAAGGRFVACPVGKGPAQAAEGTVPLFVGGAAGAVEAAQPLLAAIGRPMYVLGDVEQATAFKLLSNLIGMGNVALLAEGFALGLKAGIKPDLLAAALRETGANSYQLEVRLPWIVARDFAPRFSVDLALKDLRLAVDMAARMRASTPLGAAGLEAFVAAAARGLGDEDAAAVFKLFGH
jgi:3-hydroxyisobutyrate dehydrogenase